MAESPPRFRSGRGRRLALAAAAVTLLVLVAAPSVDSPVVVSCDAYASTTGSDSAGNGSPSHPYASLAKLDAALSPGQTGCLLAGTYGSAHTRYRLAHSGSPGGRITLTAAPGQRVTVKGWIDLRAAYTTISHLNIDGSNDFYTNRPANIPCPNNTSQSLTIEGPNDILEYDNYYQSNPATRGVGIGIGFWGNADNTIVRYTKIHDVGGCQAYDHLIYLSHGNNVQIYDNWMWNDPHGWGVQLYPAPTNARVYDNVIDNAGSGFVVGAEAAQATNGNQIYNNIVTHSTGLTNAGLTNGVAISDYWGSTPGTGNTFHDNLSYNNPGGINHTTNITLNNNTTAAPDLTDPTNHNYTPTTNSPAATWGLWNGTGI